MGLSAAKREVNPHPTEGDDVRHNHARHNGATLGYKL
jgi:hypothetical protein